MSGAIWCHNIQIGEEELNKIIKNYNRKNIWVKQRETCGFITTVYFNNFDIWYLNCIPSNKLFTIEEQQYRVPVNISYIERSISKSLFLDIIEPTTSLLPFQAYQFFGEGERWLI